MFTKETVSTPIPLKKAKELPLIVLSPTDSFLICRMRLCAKTVKKLSCLGISENEPMTLFSRTALGCVVDIGRVRVALSAAVAKKIDCRITVPCGQKNRRGGDRK